MDPDGIDSLDDPALRAAVGHAWGAETAPPELRRGVAQLAAAAAPAAGTAPLVLRQPRAWSGVAAAAAILLVVGLVGYRMARLSPAESHAVASLPLALASDLVTTHDFCCSHPDHHMPGVPRSDFARIAAYMHRRLGWPVLAAALPADGWVFHGAAVCPVGPHQSAHLVFKSPNSNVSLFSLSPSVVPASADNTSFDFVESGHPIAGFATSDGVYCIVGNSKDGSLTLDRVRLLRDELRPKLAAAPPAPRTTLAGLQR